jgi:hypothetical protein
MASVRQPTQHRHAARPRVGRLHVWSGSHPSVDRAGIVGEAYRKDFAMAGQRRLVRQQKPVRVKRDRIAILLVVGLTALGITISLVFTHYGWVPVESFAP